MKRFSRPHLFNTLVSLFSVTSMATYESVLQHLYRFLPEIKISPIPERIFLSTIKVLLVPAMNLSLSQCGAIGALILLTNSSAALRKATVQLYGYLSLIIGAEIAFINAYVLVSRPYKPLCYSVNPLTGLLVDFSFDDAATFDDSHVESPEQHYSCLHGLGHSLSAREGQGSSVELAD
jgi:hypothetical protein